jgi:hypothetical protein
MASGRLLLKTNTWQTFFWGEMGEVEKGIHWTTWLVARTNP